MFHDFIKRDDFAPKRKVKIPIPAACSRVFRDFSWNSWHFNPRSQSSILLKVKGEHGITASFQNQCGSTLSIWSGCVKDWRLPLIFSWRCQIYLRRYRWPAGLWALWLANLFTAILASLLYLDFTWIMLTIRFQWYFGLCYTPSSLEWSPGMM